MFPVKQSVKPQKNRMFVGANVSGLYQAGVCRVRARQCHVEFAFVSDEVGLQGQKFFSINESEAQQTVFVHAEALHSLMVGTVQR